MWKFKETLALSQIVGQINAFYSDKEDEFQIVREDGAIQGIFKTWAVPVIPFLETGTMNILSAIWPSLSGMKGKGFSEKLQYLIDEGCEKARIALHVYEEWNRRSQDNPMRLKRSLEKARLYSWLMDKKLAKLFASEPLEDKVSNRIRQMVTRLHLALGILSPLYHLETIVGDPKQTLGIEPSAEETNSGVLDVAPFLLPAAFRNIITAKRLDWNGLTWKLLKNQTKELLAKPVEGKILLNLSRLTGAPPHHILFAANALEWIPSRVGGKKDDPISTTEALAQLDKVISQPDTSNLNTISVLAETNALIRFLNWVPLIEGDDNFQGRNWTYASICDTSGDLFKTLSDNPEVWRDGFEKTFHDLLKPQLENLDAASAKGRFLLHLILVENRLKNEFFPDGLDLRWQEQVVRHLIDPLAKTQEIYSSKKHLLPYSLIGGKPFGLTLASYVLPNENIMDGFALHSDIIDALLMKNTKLWQTIIKLHQAERTDSKYRLSQKIYRMIVANPLPQWMIQIIQSGLAQFPSVNLWAVRSATQEEGEARGVYKTLLKVKTKDCPKAVAECIASYYSRAAIHFRMATGAGDLPDFALLIQPYKKAQGGVGIISDNEYAISIGSTPAKVTAGKPVLAEICGNGKTINRKKSTPALTSVINILNTLGGYYGPAQIEWIGNPNDTAKLLQMELISHLNGKIQGEKRSPTHSYTLCSLEQIREVEKLLREKSDNLINIQVNKTIRLDTFQGELLCLIAQYGRRIISIQLQNPVSPSSHFANICRFFEINLY